MCKMPTAISEKKKKINKSLIGKSQKNDSE